MKAGKEIRCPECATRITYETEQFRLFLAQAKTGVFDPWRDMRRIEKPA